MDSKNVGMIGLGLMGTALSERLLGAGYTVWVNNRTRKKADPLLARGARWSDNPLHECDRVVVSLFTTDIVDETLNRLDAGLRPGHILIDTTTGAPDQAAKLGARLADRGVQYLDAPISGSSDQTRNGEAVVLASGDRGAFDACADLWPVLGKKTHYVGACGSAGQMKLVTNLVLGLNRIALAEGLAFAEVLGIEPESALAVLRESAAYSRTMDVKGRKMIDRDYSVQARLSQHLKDVRLILQASADAGLSLPLSSLHQRLLEQAESAGLGEMDNSAIFEIIRKAKS